AGAAPHEYPVTQPFVADLMITYAFDMPGLFPAVSAHDLRELALTQDELHEIAMANLRRQFPQEVGFEGEPPILMLVTGNELEACALLMDDVWNSLAAEVP